MENRAQFAPPVRTGRHGLLVWVRAAADPVAAIACLIACNLLWGVTFGRSEVVLCVLTFLLLYPNTVAHSSRPRDIARTVLTSWLLAAGALWVFGMVTGMIEMFDGRVLVTWFVITPFAQFAAQTASPRLLRHLATINEPLRIVVVGANELGLAFTRSVVADPLSNAEVVAFFDDREGARVDPAVSARIAGRISAVGQFVRVNDIDQIYVALPMASQRRVLDLLDDLRDTTASVYFVPNIFMFDLIQARVDSMAGFPVLAVCESPFRGVTGAVKRVFDLLVASVVTVLVLPLLALIALAIRLDSPGPVIFKQRRYGLDGREIVVYKFRSMTVTEDGHSQYQQVTVNDSRMTRVGRVLRRTSLDELPQFINVLQGRMSVVGPRPHAIAVNDQYRKLIPGYMVRHKVRPGITGWAQVNGYRGGDDLDLMSKRIQYDLDYLRTWSIWLDIRIIIRTVAVVFRDDSAY